MKTEEAVKLTERFWLYLALSKLQFWETLYTRSMQNPHIWRDGGEHSRGIKIWIQMNNLRHVDLLFDLFCFKNSFGAELEEYWVCGILALVIKTDLIQAVDQNRQYLQYFSFKHSSLEWYLFSYWSYRMDKTSINLLQMSTRSQDIKGQQKADEIAEFKWFLSVMQAYIPLHPGSWS